VHLDAVRGFAGPTTSGPSWRKQPGARMSASPTTRLPCTSSSDRTGPRPPGRWQIIPLGNARIIHRLIPHSQLRIYHGGHLELAADTERLASAVETFLNADLTAEGSQQ